MIFVCDPAPPDENKDCVRGSISNVRTGKQHATASVLSGRAGLTPVAMETELRSKRQPAVEDRRVVVTGLTSKS